MGILILESDINSSSGRRNIEEAWSLLRTSLNRNHFQKHLYPQLGSPEKLFSDRKTQASGMSPSLNPLIPQKAYSTLKK